MYKHLSREERYQIHSLLKAKHTPAQIARLLSRSPGTMSREIKRGSGQRGYRAEQACNKAKDTSLGSRTKRIASRVWSEVANYLSVQCSPEQIANKLPISHETVYQHVYADKAKVGNLHEGLRSPKPRRKRHLCGRDRRGQMRHRLPIGDRPAHIEARKQVGHWEGDTVISPGHSQAIDTLVDRKSGYAKIIKVVNKTAELVSQAIEDALKPLSARVKTLTVDNGKEFAYQHKVDAALKIQTYFADPCCSWQRGSNENFNGLLRQ